LGRSKRVSKSVRSLGNKIKFIFPCRTREETDLPNRRHLAARAEGALVTHSLGGDMTSGYIVMTPERLREPAQRVCDRLKVLCGIAAVDGKNVAKL
jgi:hypothetical protein